MEEKLLTRYELNNSFIFFQGKTFLLKEIKTRLITNEQTKESLEANGMLEVLPSVYMKLEIIMPEFTLIDRVLKKMGHQKMVDIKYEEKYKLFIDVRNIRDSYRFHTFVSQYIPSTKEKTELIEKNVIQYLSHDNWGYPDSLGGGPRDCPIWGHFKDQGIFTTFGEQYKLLSVSDLLEVTSYRESYIEKFCMNSKTCSVAIEKFMSGSYLPGNEINKDDIEADLYGTYYTFGEGQHRRCAAKRAKSKSVPVLVDIYKKTGEDDEIEYLNWMTELRNNYKDSEDMLQECYEQYGSLGLTKEQIRYLNENIKNDCYISYIEEITGELFENLKLTNSSYRLN